MATSDDERLDPRQGIDPLSYVDHLARYMFAARVAFGHVLDAACGIGYGAALVASRSSQVIASVLACDISADAIRYAKENFHHKSVKYHVRNVLADFPMWDGPFTTILAFEMIEHLGDPEAFLANAKYAMTGDGLLIISTPAREFNPPGVERRTKHHINEYTTDEFYRLLSAYFNHVAVFSQDVLPAVCFRRAAPSALAYNAAEMPARMVPPIVPGGSLYIPRQPWSVNVAVCSARPLIDTGLNYMTGVYIGGTHPPSSKEE